MRIIREREREFHYQTTWNKIHFVITNIIQNLNWSFDFLYFRNCDHRVLCSLLFLNFSLVYIIHLNARLLFFNKLCLLLDMKSVQHFIRYLSLTSKNYWPNYICVLSLIFKLVISFHLLLNTKEEKSIENSIKFKRNWDNFEEKYLIKILIKG